MHEPDNMDLDQKAAETITLLKEFFSQQSVDWWLEAGTALAAWRDGKMMDWDHDIDLAIWFEHCPKDTIWRNYFENTDFEVIFQKNFPYLDNIIQLRQKTSQDSSLIDVDIYLYKRHLGSALMRWLHNPTGTFSQIKRLLFLCLSQLVEPRSDKWRQRSRFLPKPVATFIFFVYLTGYMATSSCRYHSFPEHFFLELQNIKFCGVEVQISRYADEYLHYRYGPNWRKPDPQFNQSGKWKRSLARPELPLNYIPKPKLKV